MSGDEEPPHFLVDVSALVYGGVQYFEKWLDHPSLFHPAVYYIPYYTLKELDFLKKSFNKVIAANARESIRFIDRSVSQYDDGLNQEDSDSVGYEGSEISLDDDITDFESYNQSKKDIEREKKLQSVTSLIKSLTMGDSDVQSDSSLMGSSTSSSSNTTQFHTRFILEPPGSAGPAWKKTCGYRKRTPLVSEFPKANGFTTSLLGTNQVYRYKNRLNGGQQISRFPTFNSFSSKKKPSTSQPPVITATMTEDDIAKLMEEKNLTFDEAINNMEKQSPSTEEKAVTPKRLKLLLRSAIQKEFVDNKHRASKIHWIVICEDEATAIWLRCYNLDVMSISRAGALLKKGDITDSKGSANTSGSDNSISDQRKKSTRKRKQKKNIRKKTLMKKPSEKSP